jgi:hypothetical protein
MTEDNMMTKSKLYFAYGANINIESMSYRCPYAEPVRTLMLRDWELVFYNHANIEHKKGAVVPGVLWDVTEYCEESLDAFEGFPLYYTKRTWEQDGIEFFFYEMGEFRNGTPSTSYLDNIQEGYNQWGITCDLYANNAIIA